VLTRGLVLLQVQGAEFRPSRIAGLHGLSAEDQ
jgi:hypothetical protein